MRARPLIPVLALLVATALCAPAARAAACALSAGTLAVPVGDGGRVILTNDGTAVAVEGATDCTTPIAQITAGIAISGTSGDNAVEVRLHPTVAFPVIALVLSGGADTLLVLGSASADAYSLSSRFSGGASVAITIDGGAGDDVLSALSWPNGVRLLGGSGDDTLIGTTADDVLDGGPNDDTLSGRYGADALEGGLGSDDADYAQSPGGVRVTLNGTQNTGGDATGDTLSGLEGIIGSPYADTLIGGAGADALLGGSGDDALEGRGGPDLIGGGLGADTASYATSLGAVTVSLGVTASGGDAAGDQLVGVESLVGSPFADRLTGDGLANRLVGGGGNDTLAGGAGDDILAAGAGNDRLDGGTGRDTVSFEGSRRSILADLTKARATGDGTDTLLGFEDVIGGSKADILVGDGRANALSGGGGVDSLYGGGGGDRLLGGAGADRLLGGPGADYLDGGKGADVCDGEADLDTYKACDGTGKP